jgi:hypothetical protein
MGVKASFGVGLKSAQAWCYPCSIKGLFKDIRSALIPSLPLLHTFPFLLVVLEIGRQIQMCLTNRRDLPHFIPFPLYGGWIADFRVDYEIRGVIVDSGIGPHTLFFL